MTHQPTSVLLVPHAGRAANINSAAVAARMMREAGIAVRILINPENKTIASHPVLRKFPSVTHGPGAVEGIDLVFVTGGDGTFLRAADLAYFAQLPVLGINLGHIGFLAEWEKDSLEEAVLRVISGDYRIEERMTLNISALGPAGEPLGSGWALNELSVENQTRTGVLDAILDIDGRPVSSYGCDGIIVSTPTGSTAYAFSAGGPVLWPELDAILVVPNNAHALFTKPLVVAPGSTVAIESSASSHPAYAVMDGFRTIELPPGFRVEIRRGQQGIQWVRLDDRPFTDRLVSKLKLPTQGWRGPIQTR
ncbi:NAD kinase [Corynebacterium sp. ES2794-CONJ1]|nr:MULTISPECIES: NAD kinase [unclassified Corynebacterium]MCS4489413.1 NAD kinase [Corynebacterium sp. ES2775-CONJ]MCS4491224.1 NAD kinase [Corynebacterium sp. ES2715-CONJ3]MCS4530895.1 NAD kinase [Corynebacterium sp. ES2730-CONJ]MCU9518260.1 NAD kinase [Corynebacterium sp. ES2794-CONJ1]